MSQPASGWRQVRGLVVHSHLLYDEEGVYLIDGGFLGGVGRIQRCLRSIGRDWGDVKAILLTHGHLDHTLNIAQLQERSGARVFAPAADEAHVAGRYRYRGITRFCGISEAVGRLLLRFHPPRIDQWFAPNEELEFWGGLVAVHLPGHTVGHTGFYSPSRRLLFSGDLFANFLVIPRVSPPWFTDDMAAARRSLHIAAGLDLVGVLPNHSRRADPGVHLSDLQKLARRNLRSRSD